MTREDAHYGRREEQGTHVLSSSTNDIVTHADIILVRPVRDAQGNVCNERSYLEQGISKYKAVFRGRSIGFSQSHMSLLKDY